MMEWIALAALGLGTISAVLALRVKVLEHDDELADLRHAVGHARIRAAGQPETHPDVTPEMIQLAARSGKRSPFNNGE